jgi:leucyl aminopeptidase
MADLGMGALLGVAQGSVKKPRLLAMRWKGKAGTKPTALSARACASTPAGSASSLPPAWKT